MNTAILNPVQYLVTTASLATGVAESRIYSPDCNRRLVSIRWAIFIILRREGWSLSAIGDAFCKDHSTVMNGIGKGTARLTTDRWFSALVNYLQTASIHNL
jgi:chromosomal replication initiation ATPase DnaA